MKDSNLHTPPQITIYPVTANKIGNTRYATILVQKVGSIGVACFTVCE